MRKRLILLFTLAVTGLGACKSQHDIVLKSRDTNFKLTKANEYYDQKKWHKAVEVYETLMPVFKGTKNYEELFYRYCYSFYNMKDYLSASYQFKNFTENFPRSSRADECEFMYAISLYKLSNKPSLDQTSTYRAMEALQTYINTHPGSSHLTEANNYIDVCREKIETKDANAALLYFNMGSYKAATVAYKSVMDNYPESKDMDSYHVMLIRSYYLYAKASKQEKQEERFAEAVNAYNEMLQYMPQSPKIKEAEKYATSSQNYIKNLRNEHK